MGFGRPRAPSPERGGASPRARRLGSLLALAAALAFSGCFPWGGGSAAAFSSTLIGLDVLIAADKTITGPLGPAQRRDLDQAFSRARAKARSVPQWLSVLKRAKASEAVGDSGRFAAIADLARKSFAASEPIAAVSALAYLGDGRPADALALFPSPILPDSRPALWAACVVSASSAAAARAAATASDYDRLAQATGSGRPYLGAAVSALAAKDPSAARAWLGKALDAGMAAPPGLLWDCGLYEDLSAMSEAEAGPAELALMGDAAWMTGDRALAARRWARSIALSPGASWKPYADLALSSGEGERAESYWSRLKAAFLEGPPSPARDGALEAYAADLARRGMDREALVVLKGASGSGSAGPLAVLRASLEGRGQSEGRFASALEALAARMPGDPSVQGAALRALLARGMYGEAAILEEAASRGGVAIPEAWYYQAALLAARGDFAGASAAIEAAEAKGLPVAAAGDFALGSLYGAMGETEKSVEAYSRAAASASGPKGRGSALKALGRALGDSGNAAGAASAYARAAAADPADPEAALLARLSSGKK